MEVARYMEDGRQVDGRRGDRYIDGGMGGRVGEGVGEGGYDGGGVGWMRHCR